MMTDTGETAGEISRDGNSNSNSNSTADPIYRCCCTARSWTLASVCFKMLVVGLILILALALPSSLENSGRGSGSRRKYSLVAAADADAEDEAPSESTGFIPTVIFWTLLSLIFYSVAMVGAVKEKTILISCYGLLLSLEGLVAGVLVFRGFFRRNNPLLLDPVTCCAWLLFNSVAVSCTAAFLKRVEIRKAPPLESEPTTLIPLQN